MLRLQVLGGGRRVGRSALLLEGSEARLLLDYGVDISGKEPEFPLHVRPREVSGVVLTHAHLDHSGAGPLLYVSAGPPLYATNLTLDLTELLTADFLKLSGYYVPYNHSQVAMMRERAIPMNFDEGVEGKGFKLRFWSAGHIPGSAMVEVEMEGSRVLYTGDFNTVDTCLLSGAPLEPFKHVDVVVMEGTYVAFDHPPRDSVERKFVKDLVEVLDGGGNVLIPTFAVGRSQEILCILAKFGIKYPVYVDGMARRVNAILLEHLHSLRDPELYKRAVSTCTQVTDRRERSAALREPSIIISPAAMLKGGASVHYAKRIVEDPQNAIFFVSYLIQDTPARELLETGIVELDAVRKAVAARVEWYDFSSHCGRSELLKAIELTRPDVKIVLVHSEDAAGRDFTEHLARKMDLDVMYPTEGESLELKF